VTAFRFHAGIVAVRGRVSKQRGLQNLQLTPAVTNSALLKSSSASRTPAF
jgi:hypothetical protein